MSGEKSQGNYCEYKCLSVSRASIELIQELECFPFRSIGYNLASFYFSLCAEIRNFLKLRSVLLLYCMQGQTMTREALHYTVVVIGVGSAGTKCLYRSRLLRCIAKPCSVHAPVIQSRRKCLLLEKGVGFAEAKL